MTVAVTQRGLADQDPDPSPLGKDKEPGPRADYTARPILRRTFVTI